VLNKDAKGTAKRFMDKLKNKGFVMARSQNTEEDYTKAKMQRDNKAVKQFTETDLFQDILKLR
jgi:hypothetical protein